MENISARSEGRGRYYDQVREFQKRHHGRKLREVMDAEIDIADVIQ